MGNFYIFLLRILYHSSKIAQDQPSNRSLYDPRQRSWRCHGEELGRPGGYRGVALDEAGHQGILLLLDAEILAVLKIFKNEVYNGEIAIQSYESYG